MKDSAPRLRQLSQWTGILLCVLLAGLPATAKKIRFCDTSNKWNHPFCDWSTSGPIHYWYSASSAYAGDTVMSGTTYSKIYTTYLGGRHWAAVREDTTLRKVYFRLISGNDNAEHILYDYNLGSGDTLKIDFASTHHRYVVRQLDSVQMAGAYYRRWQVSGITYPYGPNYLIEGIGTNRTPLSLIFPNSFENANQLRCFSSQGSHPRCSPATPLFATHFMYPLFAPQPIPVDSFDNDSSCVIQYYFPGTDQVSRVQASPDPLVTPNPGGREARLIMPSSAGVYTLTIRDVTGRIVATVEQSRAAQQPIGRLVQNEGLYFYLIQPENGQRLSGKFLFR